MKLNMKLPSAISKAFQKLKNKVCAVISKDPQTPAAPTIPPAPIENFVTVEWKDNTAVLLCIKCEEPFNVDPCGEENLVWCNKKRVLVPQCPHCGTNDIEKC